MEGQIFSGKVAASKGLVTGLTTSFNQLLGELNGKAVARASKPKAK
jgi:hypothetical protein